MVALPSTADVSAALRFPGDGPGPGAERHGAVVVCDDPIDTPTEGGSPRSFLDDLVAALLEAGRAVATIDSTLQLDERFVSGRLHTELALEVSRRAEVDRARMGVVGRGAGAMPAVAAAMSLGPAPRLCLLSPATPELALNLCEQRAGLVDMPAVLERASTMEIIKSFTGPALILHGAADERVRPESSLAYLEAMELAGRRVEHLFIACADHELTQPAARAACLAEIAAFMSAIDVPAGQAASS
jgi:pimeloyl-ACP methyl ester carboxylesterase